MKKLVLAAALVGAASFANAGSMEAPIMEPEVIVEESAGTSSGGIIIPMLLLLIAAAVAAD